jgi:hypothetical protein
MYRILRQAGESGERRRQASHPARKKPELMANGPSQVWSWDITKLRGPHKGVWYQLYVLIDIYSRYVTGWMCAANESAELAEALIADAVDRNGTAPLSVHADRGTSMTSKTVAELLSGLDVHRSHSRPRVSNDNPYSEANFKTLKYCPDFPERFGSLQHARTFCEDFFTTYNHDHRHSGIGLHTPASVCRADSHAEHHPLRGRSSFMSQVRVDTVFQASSEPILGRTCSIDPALAARPLTAQVGVFGVVLEFPPFEGRVPAEGYVGWASAGASAPVGLCPAYFTAHTVFDHVPGPDAQALDAQLKDAVAAIRFAAARLSDALRVEQPNVGMVGEIPKMFSLTATNLARGVALAVPEPLIPGFPMVVGLPALSVDDAMSALRDGVPPSRALLSQARYLTLPTNSPQPGMAILLAAVAAETYAKESLKSRRPAGSTPSLRSLMDEHGTTVKLYGPIAKAVIGRSLEAEDPALFSDLESLFNARNRMAHKLKMPTHLDARQLVIAAVKAMDWLG